jgi:dienelactone hydrolase
VRAGQVHVPVVRVGDPRLPDHTVLRPRDATPFRLPVVVWGNGGCRTTNQEHTRFLTDLASRGYLVIAYGAPSTPFDPNRPEALTERPEAMVAAIDWAVAEDQRAGSPLQGRVDTHRVVAMGQSCGASEALVASRDTRVSATLAFDRGGSTEQLHAPVLFWTGGGGDGGTPSARVAYDALAVPAVFVVKSDAGHIGPWHDPRLEAAALTVTTSWLDLTLYDDPTARTRLIGPRCGLCGRPTYSVSSKGWR